MRLSTLLALFATLLAACGAFTVPPPTFGARRKAFRSPLSSSAPGGGGEKRRSRIEGNQRQPTEEEMTIMDDMITKLANAKPYELPNAVKRAFRVCSSPQFFLRIADRADKATDETEKAKLSALASNLVATLEAVVETTEEQLDERAKEVEMVVKAAAEPESGEFLVPLTPQRVDAMREALEKVEPSLLDEGFLSTVDAWMMKSHQDGMDGMVGILQKVLQIFAGKQLLRARAANSQNEVSDSAASKLFDELLETDTDSWDAKIKSRLNDEISSPVLVKEIQKCMESVVLAMENGSMKQRVVAEYLTELVQRVEAAK